MDNGTTTASIAGEPGTKGRLQDGTWQKGVSGNPAGRPKGARHKTTVAIEAMLAGQAQGLTQKAIELALNGDTVALRLCLDRLAPPRRSPSVDVELPPLESPADAIKAMSALATAVTAGNISPSEAAELGKLVDSFVRAIETHDLADRVAALEAKK